MPSVKCPLTAHLKKFLQIYKRKLRAIMLDARVAASLTSVRLASTLSSLFQTTYLCSDGSAQKIM